MACQVVGNCNSRCKDQAIRRNPAAPGLTAQILRGRRIRPKQPENAVCGCGQEAHPDIEYLRIDLVSIVEAAKHKAVLGQTTFAPTRHMFGDGILVVIGLVAVREPHHALAVETEMLLINDRRIRDNIIYESAPIVPG